ncbi:hypothetical protein [Microcella sp.]|uniref:hypothetical protein n=1 Tax=Microcella sp. TaxID=1913979 RepID=UPI00256ACCEE|nr:hypothetical protein [Microcella sp.]MBX9471661.1 hypothetical protein [Microcella sp.]
MESPRTRATTTTATGRATTTNDHVAADPVFAGVPPRSSAISWGAVFAGVVTFIAVTVLLSLVTAGIGLGGAGVAAGIWSIIATVIALFAAGWVAGALALRSGLLHGFLTWATSLVAGLALTFFVGASALGAVGGAVSNAADDVFTTTDIEQLIEDINSGEFTDEETVDEASDTAQASAWWSFAGLLIGAGIATLGGAAGVRTVVTRDTDSGAHAATTTR